MCDLGEQVLAVLLSVDQPLGLIVPVSRRLYSHLMKKDIFRIAFPEYVALLSCTRVKKIAKPRNKLPLKLQIVFLVHYSL